jgi:hypothetical protein
MMAVLAFTYDTAYAAGRDAGNRNMRRNGRTVWDEDDYAAAVAAMCRLLPPVDADGIDGEGQADE